LTHIGIEEEMRIEKESRNRNNATPTSRASDVPAGAGGALANNMNGNHTAATNNDPQAGVNQRQQGEDENKKQRTGWFWYILLRTKPAAVATWRYPLSYWEIIMNRRLRNAAIASSVVAVSQAFSGINLMAFYGAGFLVGHVNAEKPLGQDQIHDAMVFNLIFGLLNFLFCLPSIHYIDSLGRRKLLLFTIPGMALSLMAAAVSVNRVARGVVAWWVYCESSNPSSQTKSQLTEDYKQFTVCGIAQVSAQCPLFSRRRALAWLRVRR
jgi:hypothetical protein